MEILLQPRFISEVAKQVHVGIKRQLSKIEIEHLIQYIREINPSAFNRKSPKDLVVIISQNYIKRLKSSRYYYDNHEISKGHLQNNNDYLYSQECGEFSVSDNIPLYADLEPLIGDNSVLRIPNKTSDIKSSDIKSVSTDMKLQPIQNIYLLLDSKYRNLSTDLNVFKWVINNNTNTVQGSVNTLASNIKNIINIQFSNIQIPYTPSADNVYKKISLFIEEFSSMAILAHPNIRYHMLFDSSVAINRINLIPDGSDDGYFRFYKPLNILDSITIIFKSPFSEINFLKDRYHIHTNNGLVTTLVFSEPHNMTDGELIHIEGYGTLATNLDIIQITDINKDTGHIVTYIDNYNLSINVITTTVTPDPNNTPLVFVASRRILIPMRLEYLI